MAGVLPTERSDDMKIGIAADIHMGLTTHGFVNKDGINSRVIGIGKIWAAIVDRMIAEEVKVVLLPGDIFDGTRPTPTEEILITKGIRRLLRSGAQVFLLPGNHEMTPENTSIDLLGAFGLPGITVYSKAGGDTIKVKGGEPFHLIALPSFAKAHYLARSGSTAKLRIEEVYAKLTSIVEDIIVGLAKDAPADIPRICIAHLATDGIQYGSQAATYEVSVRGALFEECGIDYAFLGHIHNGQQIARRVYYPGSIDRAGFEEAGSPKGFLLLDLQEGCPNEPVFIPVDCTDFVHIGIDLSERQSGVNEEVEAALKRSLGEFPGAYVRVEVKLKQEDYPILKDKAIRDFVAKQKAYLVKLSIKTERAKRARTTAEEMQPMTSIEDQVRFYLQRAKVSPDTIDRALILHRKYDDTLTIK